jgi:SAM-dependent methyltransferase
MRDDTDSEFYLDQIRQVKGSILEVGVGTGRLFMNALNSDADIYGIDISPSMLDILRAKLSAENQKRISLQNIINFRLDKRFDLIIAPFRVFMHLTEKDEQLNALNNIYNHLNPGGRFIFDVFVPDLKPLITGLENVPDFEGEYEPGNRMKRTVSTKPDIINQIINITFRLEWNEGDSNQIREWDTPLRFFFRFELEHLVERSRFKTYRILGDFRGNDLSKDSKEFIIICHK